MQEPGQAQQGSGEGLGGFGAKPGQAQQSSEEGSGEGLGGFGAEPCKSGATGLRRRFRGRSGRLWCRARSGFWRRFWRRSGRLFGADPAEVIPALGKNKTLRLLGIPPTLIFLQLHRLSIETRSKWIYWLFTAASHRIFLINMFSPFHVSRNPMDSLQNAGVPALKNPPWDPVVSVQCAWVLFELISIFVHGPRYFSHKMQWSAKVEVGPGPFYKVASLQNDL